MEYVWCERSKNLTRFGENHPSVEAAVEWLKGLDLMPSPEHLEMFLVSIDKENQRIDLYKHDGNHPLTVGDVLVWGVEV